MAGSPLFHVRSFVSYWLKAVGPHKVHSPFVYKLVTQLFKEARSFRVPEIEALRIQLLRNQQLIDTIDFKNGTAGRQTVSSIARMSASSKKFAALLSLLIDELRAESVLETGTSLGLTTLYLASSKAKKVTTIEGSNILRQLAQTHFQSLKKDHIDSQHGDIHLLLPYLLEARKPDFIFLDADHRGTVVMQQIEHILQAVPAVKCIVIHDIHWSADMNSCWLELAADPRINLTIDIFQAGLVFPKMDMEKQHFTLRF